MNQSSILTACEHVLWHNEHRITASSQQGQKLLNFSANTFKLHNSTTNNNLKNIYIFQTCIIEQRTCIAIFSRIGLVDQSKPYTKFICQKLQIA